VKAFITKNLFHVSLDDADEGWSKERISTIFNSREVNMKEMSEEEKPSNWIYFS
jgi:hypothetical protein